MGVMGWRGHPYFGQGVVRPPLGQKEKKNGKIGFAFGGGRTTPKGHGGGLATPRVKQKK
jgi:hypothetical protein